MSSVKYANLSGRRSGKTAKMAGIINAPEELEAALQSLVKRGIIRKVWMRRRFEYDALVVRIEFHNDKYQEWVIPEMELRQDSGRGMQYWVDHILRSIMRENENSALKIITDNMRIAVPLPMMYRNYYRDEIYADTAPIDPPAKKQPAEKSADPSNAYRLNNIDL